jgi:hypothetical protein
MEDFSPEQINSLTTAYEDMARALNEYQVTHWSELTHEQQFDLNAYQNSLLNRAHDLQTLTVRPAFTNPAEMEAVVKDALGNAKQRLYRLNNLTVALNIGAIAVALASYVSRANLRGIQTALRELDTLLGLDEE